MPNVIELFHPALTAYDRRRSGRVEDVNPALLPLLRGGAVNDNDLGSAAVTLEADDPDNLATARGIAMAVAFSSGVWLALGVVLGWF